MSKRRSRKRNPKKRGRIDAFNNDKRRKKRKKLVKKETKKENEVKEEIDPLDAFFQTIDSQLEKENKKIEFKKTSVITLDDILSNKNNAVKQEKEEEDDSEKFHKLLVKKLKNGETEKEIFRPEEFHMSEQTVDLEEEENYANIKNQSNKKELKLVDHSKIEYPYFRKNFYIPSQEIKNLTSQEIEVLHNSFGVDITLKGENIPTAIQYWKQSGIDDRTLARLHEKKYAKPFAIQGQAIPTIMSGRDVIGIAPTGSGKTLAYIVPMIRHILDQPKLKPMDGPIGLICAPTRELCLQISKEFNSIGRVTRLRSVPCFGGGNMSEQIAQLRNGAHVVVCTPGRMIDLLTANRGKVTNLRRVTYVVIDEADRMFDFGFAPQITRIVSNVRPDKQLVLFSATFPKPLEALVRRILRNCVEIIVGGRSVANKKVSQFVEVLDENEKFLRLLELLGIWHLKGNILIFVKAVDDTGLLYKDLLQSGYDSLVVNSAMHQMDRDETIKKFKSQKNSILIGTSLVARGIDVPNVELVINYDVPISEEEYVHQVGRTARGNKEGTAYTFIKPTQEQFASFLVKAMKKVGNSIPKKLEELNNKYLEKVTKKQLKKQAYLRGYTGHGFQFNENEMSMQQQEINLQKKSFKLDKEGNLLRNVAGSTTNSATKKGTTTFEENIIEKEKAAIVSRVNEEMKKKKHNKASSVDQAKAFAMSLTIQAKLENNTDMNKEEVFHEEIEINDYPQIVRMKVTKSNSPELYQICEETNCEVSTKGIFVPQGQSVNHFNGDRKLYLKIQGNNEMDVRNCKLKIYKLLESSNSSIPRSSHKYSVI